MAEIVFVTAPDRLPPPPAAGRVALVDVAFAYGDEFRNKTRPWLETVGDRLALWVDHHEHPEWSTYRSDPRFVLAPKKQAPACPQLITPELVARTGPVDTLLAHADFDGLMSAVKFLRLGVPPYEASDEDARAIDDPMGGHSCTPRGLRLARALDYASTWQNAQRFELLSAIAQSLVAGTERSDLTSRLDEYAAARLEQERELSTFAERAEQPHPQILLVRSPRALISPDKKAVLRALQARAAVGIVHEGGYTTVASSTRAIDLTTIAVNGLKGGAGYAWCQVPPDEVVRAVAAALARTSGSPDKRDA